ncbi:hypothetical protein ACOIWI_004494 [Vibrio vulnificus]|uniref:hypothetical protein n=1 Tax=Vibrio vulnificus TaxID=672 RepID=UPI001A34566B|nr:hypothetical protein [Vibrio vulnificus]ELX4200216.1 hypothetical protein [Vibrio vulnificus]ELY5145846.1 hypothetical protein [Vibrio vulnificus]MCA0781465.1 hypothetical protein [Vibrio vulnificus]HAS6222289.1 hypothetical protein [Vibrio vulnificus]HAT8530772.1 hypothetical protein [Vibrio vulnificus]
MSVQKMMEKVSNEYVDPLEVLQNIINKIKSIKSIWLWIVLAAITVISCTATYYSVISGLYDLTKNALDISPVLEDMLSANGFIIDPILWATVPMLYIWSVSLLFYRAIKNEPEKYNLLVDIVSLVVGTVGSVVMTSGAWLLGMAIAASIHYVEKGIISLAITLVVIGTGQLLRSKFKPDFTKEEPFLNEHHLKVSLACFVGGSVMWAYLALSDAFGRYSAIYDEIIRLSVK